MSDRAVDEQIVDRVVRTVEYNTGGGSPEAIDAHHVRVHLCVNGEYLVEAVTNAITAAVKRGDLVEREGGYATADADS